MDLTKQAMALDAAIPKVTEMADKAVLVTGAFKALSGTTGAVTKAFNDLATSTADRLANFSPDISIQNSRNQINRANQNWKQADQIGGELAEFQRQQGRIEIGTKDIQGDALKIVLPVLNKIADNIATIINAMGKITEWASEQADKVPDWVKDQLGNAAAPVLALLANIAKLLGIANDRDQGQGGIDALNEFFNMAVPAPMQPAKIKGPVFAMPMPQFKPPGMEGAAQ